MWCVKWAEGCTGSQPNAFRNCAVSLVVFRVLGSPLPCRSHASRKFSPNKLAADVLRAVSEVAYGQHILDTGEEDPDLSPELSLWFSKNNQGEGPAAGIPVLLGMCLAFSWNVLPPSWGHLFKETQFGKTLLNPPNLLNLCSLMEPELGWRGSGPGWGSGAQPGMCLRGPHGYAPPCSLMTEES